MLHPWVLIEEGWLRQLGKNNILCQMTILCWWLLSSCGSPKCLRSAFTLKRKLREGLEASSAEGPDEHCGSNKVNNDGKAHLWVTCLGDKMDREESIKMTLTITCIAKTFKIHSVYQLLNFLSCMFIPDWMFQNLNMWHVICWITCETEHRCQSSEFSSQLLGLWWLGNR